MNLYDQLTGLFWGTLIGVVVTGFVTVIVARANRETALRIAKETSEIQMQALRVFTSHQAELERVRARRPAIERIAQDFITASDEAMTRLAREHVRREALDAGNAQLEEIHRRQLQEAPDSLDIYGRLRNTYARSVFLGLEAAAVIDNFCMAFQQADSLPLSTSSEDYDAAGSQLLDLRERILVSLRAAHA